MGCSQSTTATPTAAPTVAKALDLELTYFGIPGRAEFIRLLLAYGKVDFKDTRYAFPDYFANKSSLDLPFGQVPTLRVNNTTYGQSLAIARYAAKLTGLYPADPLAALEADAVVDALVELFNAVVDAVYKTPDAAQQQAKFDTINHETFPRMLRQLEARVVGPFFTGNDVTFADVYLLDFFHNTLSNDKITVAGTDFPKLQAIVD
ncbi:glutathione S-transferase, partial [Achlya hypogyna]